MIRFYFNVGPNGAPHVLRWLSTRLNVFDVPFRFKALTARSAYTRLDAALLYVAGLHYPITAQLLGDGLEEALAPHLAAGTPVFTRRLAPGLGFAEDPGHGQSFGMSRCRIVAEAIWSAYGKGHQSPGAWLEEVKAHFTRYSLDPKRPHLNPGSAAVRYPFPFG
jgi:hypothetical protein